ncbi:MAG: OmpL47-type beta-barrel domain-containing protein [Thermoplasmatota archaeon]
MHLSLPFSPLLVAGAMLMLAVPGQALPWFEEVADDVGIDFQHAGWMPEDHNPWFPEITLGGVCWLDHDGDGWLDLFFVNGRYYDEALQQESLPTSHLYRNEGDGTFTDVSEAAGVDRSGFWDTGCSSADYDGDGWVDLFVASYDDDVLYRNNGDGTFTDVSATAGVQDAGLCGTFPCWGHSSSWVDYDNDGWLDLYVVNYVEWNETIHSGNGPRQYHGQRNLMWHNNGDGTFDEVSALTNTTDDPQPMHGKGLGVVWYDHDQDGCMDAYVASDQTPASLLHNDCNGHFEDIAAAAHVNDNYSGMGTVAGDTSGDGWPDLYKTHYEKEPNTYYINERNGTYWPGTHEGGLSTDFEYVGWGTGFFDFNNDGHLDIYVANGHTEHFDDFYGITIMPWQKNLIWFNDGAGNFQDVTDDLGPGWALEEVSRGSGVADYDLDGDLDLVFGNIANGTPDLLRASEATGAGAHWLSVELRDPGVGNWQAIGARATATLPDGHTMARHVMAGSGYLSQDQTALHFGLGDQSVADIEVIWPDGTIESFLGLAAGEHVRLERGGAVVRDLLAPTTELVVAASEGLDGWHISPGTWHLEAVDHGLAATSGIATTERRVAGGSWQDGSGVYVLPEGITGIDYRSIDHAGNVERVHHATLKLDTQPPVSEAVVDGTAGLGDWFIGMADVSLSASDATSGLDRIEYRLDGGPWTTYTEPFDLMDGVHTLEHRAVDVAGNVEAVQSLTIRVDTQQPATDLATEGPEGEEGWFRGPTTLRLEASDNLSGVSGTQVQTTAGAWADYVGPLQLLDGVHDVAGQSHDAAGNQEPQRTLRVKVDGTAPATTVTVTGAPGDADWLIADAVLDLQADDATSGVARTEYRLDEGAWITNEGASVTLPDGRYPLDARSTDIAGNIEPLTRREVAVDTVPPAILVHQDGIEGEDGWWRSDVAVTVEASDATSGVALQQVRIDGGPWSASMTPTIGSGEHHLEVWVQDAAGHEATLGPLRVGVDRTAPLTSWDLLGAEGLGDWFVSDVEVFLEASDDLSGVAVTQYRLAEGAWTDYLGPFTLGEGIHEITVASRDAAGNIEPERRFEVKVDTTAPEVRLEVGGMHLWQDDGTLDVVLGTLLELPATDATSRVALVEWDLGEGWQGGTQAFLIGTDGPRTLSFRAQDEAGNMADLQEQPLALKDKIAPDVGLLRPEPHSLNVGLRQQALPGEAPTLVAGCVPVRVDVPAHVSGVLSIEVLVDGVVLADRHWADWSSQARWFQTDWNTLEWGPGTHELVALVRDHNGNSAEVEREVLVVGAGPAAAAPCWASSLTAPPFMPDVLATGAPLLLVGLSASRRSALTTPHRSAD